MSQVIEQAPVGSTIASVTRVVEPYRVPSLRYVSPAWAGQEHERLWPHVWQLAGTLDHVAEPGDWFEYQVGWISVVVVRADDGSLRAFQNVCRHRGNALVCGEGRELSELRCGYHRFMDIFVFERRAAGGGRTPPARVTVQPGEVDFGLIVNQDVAALGRVQRGLHQPGFTEMVLSGEECRIVNLHRNLEHFLGISPSEITGG